MYLLLSILITHTNMKRKLWVIIDRLIAQLTWFYDIQLSPISSRCVHWIHTFYSSTALQWFDLSNINNSHQDCVLGGVNVWVYTCVGQYVFLSMCTECITEAKGGLQMACCHLLHYSLQTSLSLNLEVGNQQASAILLSPSPTVLGLQAHMWPRGCKLIT